MSDPEAMKEEDLVVIFKKPVYNIQYPSHYTFFWADTPSTQLVKVQSDSMIAIINQPTSDPQFSDDTVPYVDVSSAQ